MLMPWRQGDVTETGFFFKSTEEDSGCPSPTGPATATTPSSTTDKPDGSSQSSPLSSQPGERLSGASLAECVGRKPLQSQNRFV